MDFFNSKLIRQDYVCRENTNRIIIRASSDAIRVTGGDVDQVSVSYMECPGKHEFVLTEEGGCLSLEDKNISNFLWMLYQPFIDCEIRVTVPRAYNGTIELKASSGRTIVSGLTAETLAAESSSGAIRIEDVKAGRIDASGSSGALKIVNASSESDITAGCASGAIHLENTSAGKDIRLGCHSGAIGLTDTSAGGSVSAENKTGSITFKALKAEGNITLSNTTGTISGSVAGKESDYSILSHTTTGHNGLVNSRGGEKELNVSTTTGTIRITFVG